MGKKKKSKQTVGYSYYMAGIFGLCLKASKLLKIVYGDRVAWSGAAADGSIIAVDAPKLYGGEEVGGSGGLKGAFHFNCGGPNQEPNAVMKRYLGADCPAHRGIVTLSMDSSYVASFSPTFRPLYCKVQHLGYDWYTAKQTIGASEINPAHEIRDALLNPDLSGQYDAGEVDEDSFRAAADTLYAENFGLSPKWSDSGKAQEYIQELLTHIDGVLLRDRGTGKIRLKLLRGGYDVSSLPVIGEGDFTGITSLGTVSAANMVNKVTIKYSRLTDIGEETATLTGENLANIAMQGGFVNATEIEFKHLTDAIADLPGRILARELRARSYPLRSFTLTGVHTVATLQEGDLFVLQAPGTGVTNMVCRVLEADYGTLDDHIITLSCTEDIYGVASTSIAAPTVSEWQDVVSTPAVPAVAVLKEMPLYLVYAMTDMTQENILTDYPHAGFVFSLAKKNAVIDHAYYHKILSGSTWKEYGLGHFSDSALFTADVSAVAATFPVPDTSLHTLAAGDFAFVEDEIVQIVSWTSTAITVTRGIMDTLPKPYRAGTRLWLPGEDGGGACTYQYSSGNTAQVALGTFNSQGQAAVTSSSRISVSMQARCHRPYPPGGLTINGVYLAQEIRGPLAVSWKHRDRLDLMDTVVSQTAADIGPEPGTTYTLRVYDENDRLRKNLTGLTGTSWTWETEAADCDLSAVILIFKSPTVYSTNTTVSVDANPLVLKDDLLLAWVFHTSSVAAPEGWNLLGSENGTDGTSTVSLSLFFRYADAEGMKEAANFIQSEPGNMGLHLQAWRFPSGLLSLSPLSTCRQNSITSKNVVWPAHPAPVANAFTLIGGVSTYAHTSYTLWTPSDGEILSTAKVANNRLVCGKCIQKNQGDVLSGFYSFDDGARNIGTAALAVSLLTPAGTAPRQYNRQVRVELESVRDGYTSLQRWNHTVTRPDEGAPDPAPPNLLLPSLLPATATGGGISVTIHEDGTVTLDGTVTVTTALNVKVTRGLVISEPRPAAWDADALPGVIPGQAATLTVTKESGTLTTSGADGFNVTLRHSAAQIFLNAKIGDGLWTATGTPAEEVKMLVFYIRAGTVMDRLRLTLRLTQEER